MKRDAGPKEARVHQDEMRRRSGLHQGGDSVRHVSQPTALPASSTESGSKPTIGQRQRCGSSRQAEAQPLCTELVHTRLEIVFAAGIGGIQDGERDEPVRMPFYRGGHFFVAGLPNERPTSPYGPASELSPEERAVLRQFARSNGLPTRITLPWEQSWLNNSTPDSTPIQLRAGSPGPDSRITAALPAPV